MKRLLFVAYTLMAVWLLIAAARRITLQIADGLPLDWSPFVSGGIGAVSLLLLLPAIDDWAARRAREGR